MTTKWEIEIPFEFADAERFIEARKVMRNGVVEGPFMLTVDDLVSALQAINDGTSKTEGFVQMPFMPKGTIYSTHNRNMSSFHILMRCDGRKQYIQYHRAALSEGFFIDIPPVLFEFVMRKTPKKQWKVDGVKLFALDNSETTMDAPLYLFPFPHVQKSGTGYICWGTNTLPELDELTDLPRIYDLFFAAPFGEDYGMGLLSGERTFYGYCKKHEEQPFNYDDLMPTGRKVRDLVR